jgi:hypothetical protein
MRHRYRNIATLALGATFVVGACGRSHDESRTNTAGGEVVTPVTTPSANAQVGSAPVDTAPAKHHSKLGGAAAGAAAGHVLGGHAVMGAAAGAMIQHERNKHHR